MGELAIEHPVPMSVVRAERRLLVVLCAVTFAFWVLIFARSILSLDDMGFISRGRGIGSLRELFDAFRFDVVEQNGRIADGVLSAVAAIGGEQLARLYFALASTLLVPTAYIWLARLLPAGTRRTLPMYVLPAVATAAPWVLLALDRRLISQLVLFGAASSGYFTGLFLVTVGLRPALSVAVGGRVAASGWARSGTALIVGAMFHEVLAAVVAGAGVALVWIGLRQPVLRRPLATPLAVMTAAVVLKVGAPGFWSRAADSGQRQLTDVPLLERTDTALAFALIAFVPLLGYLVASLALELPERGLPFARVVPVLVTGGAFTVASLAFRVLGGLPIPGIVTLLAATLMAAAAVAARPAGLEPVELVGIGAVVAALSLPAAGGLLPGRGWFFGEFLLLLLASSWLLRAAARMTIAPTSSRFFAVAAAGAGIVLAPVLAYEMLDKVNDNYAWRVYVDGQLAHRSDGVVEIPWTYPWDDMRPSFALGRDPEPWERLVRDFYGIPDDTHISWSGNVDWTTG